MFTMLKPILLETFCTVAENNSMTIAAAQRNLTVMAISKQINQLEQEVGQPLFLRQGKRLLLTDFGHAFLLKVKQVLIAHKELSQWVDGRADHLSGKIRILSQSAQWIDETIIPYMTEFTAAHPDLIVELDVYEGKIDIQRQQADIYWGVAEYLGQFHPGLVRRPLWQSEYGVYASSDYLKKHGEPLVPEDLHNHQVITYLHAKPASSIILADESDQPVHVCGRASVATVTGMVALAIAGQGIVNAAHRSDEIIQALQNDLLKPVLEQYWLRKVESFVYSNFSSLPQPNVDAFIKFFLAKKSQWAGNKIVSITGKS